MRSKIVRKGLYRKTFNKKTRFLIAPRKDAPELTQDDIEFLIKYDLKEFIK